MEFSGHKMLVSLKKLNTFSYLHLVNFQNIPPKYEFCTKRVQTEILSVIQCHRFIKQIKRIGTTF
jgi:hypothetical protein